MHKRRHGRVRSQGIATHLHGGDKLAGAISVENLSLGGAFLRTPAPMREGTPVVMDLVRPGLKKAIRVTGRVVNTVRAQNAVPGMGVAFDPLSDEAELRLRELLAEIAPGPAVLDGDEVPLTPDLAPPKIAPVTMPPRLSPVAAKGAPPAPARLPANAPPRAPRPQPTGTPMLAPPLIAPVTVPESAKLMVQVRGLLMDLEDRQSHASSLERENASLRGENEKLKAKIVKLEAELARKR
jgi:Tfp pilus assembly protein PilZ